MARFRDIETLQKFASVHASIHNHFNHDRHLNRRQHFQTRPSSRLGRVASTRSLRAFDCRSYSSYPVSLTMPCDLFTDGECCNFFKAAGYGAN